MTVKIKSIAFLTMLSSFASYASDISFTDPVDQRFDMGEYMAEKAVGFLPVPIIITEPAVGYGGGIVGLFLHETEEEKQQRKVASLSAIDGGAQLVPAAMSVVGALGTENGTWFAFGGHRRSWKGDSIRYTGGGGLGVANIDIYKNISSPEIEIPAFPGFPGFTIGPIDKTLSFGTKTKVAALMQQVQFRVANTPLMLGIKQVAAISSVESDNEFASNIMQYMLGEEAVSSGLGILADYDTRDNLFYPTKGFQLSADYMIYDEALGSDYNYDHFNFDGQGFIPLAPKWTLGLAGNYQYFKEKDTQVTPTSKPYVKLRGVSSFRYQGDEISTVQSQITYSIDNRWKVSAFYGIGKAINDHDDATSDSVQAGGVGFRYQIARRYGLHIGMDYARSKDEDAIYFNVGSGF
ncbi:BamA/TamA family outer membrane protein [Vibrio aestuarianus]|uniref:BamA/TamA family outer membrane protein n=1 Tax=Vibrio aestuarianus TaxID=28171 RepID=UPI00237CC8EA|nr:BamA/TamA family outer membrane protein [Vibrio aestuarianus]MDE1225391.1 BamA/TamA family outer membrane protein [Vibrio aestuarianus]MDE1340409.1 BamA/TamA family outer membrane protein [Vibrio aestuarianus]